METKLDVLYEDNHLIVVVKPQNVPTQGDSSGDTSLLDMVKEYIKVKENKPGEAFVGLVHRLDRPTGGVMVFAKTSKCAKRLAEQLSDGSFEKNYFAVTVSTPRERQGRIESWLVKDTANNMVKVVPAAIVDLELVKKNIVGIIDNLCAVLNNAINAEKVDSGKVMVAFIDDLKEKASAVVYKVTRRMAKASAITSCQ